MLYKRKEKKKKRMKIEKEEKHNAKLSNFILIEKKKEHK